MNKTLLTVILFAFHFSIKTVSAQGPVVINVSPLKQVINAPRNSLITVTFNAPVDTLSVNETSFRVFSRLSGPVPGTFDFGAADKLVRFTPDTPFLAGEWVTVTLSKSIKNTNNVPMAHGYRWNFWTKAQTGSANYTLTQTIPVRRQGEGLIQCYGALGCDFNDDGRPDLAVVNEISIDFRVFLNNGNGYDTIYSIHPIPSGYYPSPSEASDFNHDGITDIVIGNAGNSVLSYFKGLPSANFQAGVPYTSGTLVRGVGIIDFNGDGWEDVVTANRGGNNISLFRNNGSGSFDPAVNINTVGTQETGVMVADANGDGIQDLFVGCYSSSEIVLLLGDGEGNFTFSSRKSLNGQPWAIAVGDINGDGKTDVAGALSGSNKIGVIFGDGSGGLGTAVNYNSGNFPLAMDIGDIDGDNDLDLISSNYGSGTYSIFSNNGSGVFSNTPVTLPASSAGSCITVLDVDNDGDMDLAGIDEVDDLLFIFKNQLVSIEQISGIIPGEFNLEQNYPNPFNPSTHLEFGIPDLLASRSEGFVSLKVYDILGKEVAVLINEKLSPGIYKATFNGSNLASGVYFYRLVVSSLNPHEAGNFSETKRMILLK